MGSPRTSSGIITQDLQDIMTEFSMIYLLDQPQNVSDFIEDYKKHLGTYRHTEITYDLTKTKSSLMFNIPTDDSSETKPQNIRRKSFYHPFEESQEYVKVHHEKTEKERELLAKSMEGVLLFSHLDQDDLDEIIDAMFERKVKAGETIIVQGEKGDNFYVMQQGVFNVYIKQHLRDEKGEEINLHVHTYYNVGSFGELALLYDQPRAATVKAATDGIIWALDRVTFKRIVYYSAMEKRKKYRHLILNSPFFTDLTNYDIDNITDAIVTKKYKAGECILKDSVETDGIYLIESGTVAISHHKEAGGISKSKTLQAGDLFGEYGMLQWDSQVVTSAFAVTDVKVAFLCKFAFERLLGIYQNSMQKALRERSVTKIR